MRALTIAQPHAEAIMRGKKLVDYRSGSTTVRGRIYIYASDERISDEDESDWLAEYDIVDQWSEDLPRGVVVGTVDLWDCTETADGFIWHFRLPVRETDMIAPKNKPMGIWFNPF